MIIFKKLTVLHNFSPLNGDRKHSLAKDNVFLERWKWFFLNFLFQNLDKRMCVTILVMVI